MPSTSSAWLPVVVHSLNEADRPSTSSVTTSKQLSNKFVNNCSDVDPNSNDIKGEITKFLEELIDKHRETLDVIERIRQNRANDGIPKTPAPTIRKDR